MCTDGIYPDDVVGRHEDDGSVVVYLGYLDSREEFPNTPAGLGFRYGGELVGSHDRMVVNTVAFVNTISGYGTDCREGGAFGCVTYQKAIFVGTGAGSADMIWTTAQSSQPFRSAFVNSGANPCPVSSNGVDVTMPVHSYEACVAVARMLGLGQPTVDTVHRVATFELPLYACVVLNSMGRARVDSEYSLVFNDLIDAHNQSITSDERERTRSFYPDELRGIPWATDGNASANVNYVCLEPETTFRRFAPPSPPSHGTQRFKTDPVQNCGSLKGPCECCRAYQQGTDGTTRDCVPAATGTLWSVSGSTSGALCTAHDTESAQEIANCEEILPYCDADTVSKVFQPLQGSKHNTLSSASFFTDVNQQYQAIVVGTAAGSANNLVYLAHADINQRELVDTIDEEAVDVDAARVGGSHNLICCEWQTLEHTQNQLRAPRLRMHPHSLARAVHRSRQQQHAQQMRTHRDRSAHEDVGSRSESRERHCDHHASSDFEEHL
jgi:hypothetical protein